VKFEAKWPKVQNANRLFSESISVEILTKKGPKFAPKTANFTKKTEFKKRDLFLKDGIGASKKTEMPKSSVF